MQMNVLLQYTKKDLYVVALNAAFDDGHCQAMVEVHGTRQWRI